MAIHLNSISYQYLGRAPLAKNLGYSGFSYTRGAADNEDLLRTSTCAHHCDSSSYLTNRNCTQTAGKHKKEHYCVHTSHRECKDCFYFSKLVLDA